MTESEIRKLIVEGGLGTGMFTDSQMVSAYDKLILQLGYDISEQFRVQILKDTKSTNDTMANSVEPLPTKNGFEITAEFYYKFIDDGVSGVGQFSGANSPIRSVVSNGLYSFKNLGVPQSMAKSIREWSGASISQAYAIGVNIKNYGIKPKNITDKVVTDAMLERISQDLLTATGIIVTASFN